MTERLYGAVQFRYDLVSEAAIFTLIGADGTEPVSVSNAFPVVGPLTNAQLRASPVDVNLRYKDVDTATSELVTGHQGVMHTANYLTMIGIGKVVGHKAYRAFGYDGSIPNTLTDISGRGANINFPAAALAMELVSSSASDTGTTVTSGTATGGSTTTLIDTGKNFTALSVSATTDYVLNDDDVILGKIASVDSATQITFIPQSEVTFSGKDYRIVRAGSTGAAVVEMHGLDSNYAEQSEFVVLNGATPVSLTKSYLRSNNMHVMVAGSGGLPVGNISLRDDATGAVTYNYIQLGLNMATQASFTVPAGKTMCITSWSFGSSGNKAIRAFLRATRDFSDGQWIPGGVFQAQVPPIILLSSSAQQTFQLPLFLPEKCDVKISANVIGAGTGEGGGGFEYWLE